MFFINHLRNILAAISAPTPYPDIIVIAILPKFSAREETFQA
jgi:hypothetical protein